MKDVIKKEQVYGHSIDQVWEAISKGDKLTEWFIKADFKPEVGYAYTFNATAEEGCAAIKGRVLKASPYELEYTWVVEGTNVETTVNWLLETVSEGTKLTLIHSGISNYPAESAVKMFESFNGGWTNCLNLLNEYLPKYATVN